MLLAALEAVQVPSSTCTNRLLLAVLEELEDSGTTQKEDIKKTPAKMLPSILHVYYIGVGDAPATPAVAGPINSSEYSLLGRLIHY